MCFEWCEAWAKLNSTVWTLVYITEEFLNIYKRTICQVTSKTGPRRFARGTVPLKLTSKQATTKNKKISLKSVLTSCQSKTDYHISAGGGGGGREGEGHGDPKNTNISTNNRSTIWSNLFAGGGGGGRICQGYAPWAPAPPQKKKKKICQCSWSIKVKWKVLWRLFSVILKK